MAEEKVTAIGDVKSATDFLKERVEKTDAGYVLKKTDAVAFMAAAGVPEAAHKQVLNAESLLFQGMYQLTADKLIENIGVAKKAGTDVSKEPVIAQSKITTLGGKHRMVATSTRTGTAPRTGEPTQSYGRFRLISDLNRTIPKDARNDFVERCKKACGAV